MQILAFNSFPGNSTWYHVHKTRAAHNRQHKTQHFNYWPKKRNEFMGTFLIVYRFLLDHFVVENCCSLFNSVVKINFIFKAFQKLRNKYRMNIYPFMFIRLCFGSRLQIKQLPFRFASFNYNNQFEYLKILKAKILDKIEFSICLFLK